MALCRYDEATDSHRGAHLSATGQYQTAITSLFPKYPNLKNRDWKVPKGYECDVYKGEAVLLELQQGKNAPPQQRFEREKDLRQWLVNTVPSKDHRRLYLLDCLHPDYVSVLGEHFGINPRLFMRQQRTALWEFGHKQKGLGRGNTPSLPSSRSKSLSCTFEYCELRWICENFPIESPSLRCAENSRHINLSRNNRRFDRTGIVHRKASFWSRANGVGGWDGWWLLRYVMTNIDILPAVLLLDPPLKQVLVGPGNDAEREQMQTEPYQGGYQDFIQHDDLVEAQQTPGPERASTLEDICYYWTRHGDLVPDLSDPKISLVFFNKIVASNYFLLTEYLNGLANEISFKLSRTFEAMDIRSLEQDWNDLQSWIPRPTEYIDRVEDILALEDVVTLGPEASWTNTKPDFELALKNLTKIQTKCHGFLNSFMGLASIVGNRQSLKEAKSVHVLTVLGTLFVPLSFAATLFSMNEAYLPVTPKFWIYFAVALPLSAIVTTVAFGYRTVLRWYRKNARLLLLKICGGPIWASKMMDEPVLPTRSSTTATKV